MLKIMNKMDLVEIAKSRLDKKARETALDALEAALEAADPKKIIKSQVLVKNSLFVVGQSKFDLTKFREVYVVGGGKASGKMAETIESILGSRITTGIVNVPYKSGPHKTHRIKLQEASHPIPDELGVEGVRNMLDIVSRAEEKDLIICLISGGGSSLMPMPRGNISLDDKKLVTEVLLKSGATINEINTVRKHISEFKGGWLAKKAYPATIVNLILSDVIGDPLDFIASGPTVPDSTTFGDAVEILKRYKLWIKIPSSIKIILRKGQKALIPETPKKGDPAFRKVHNIIVGNNHSAALGASKSLLKAGFQSLLITSMLEGESRHVGTVLASIAKEIEASGNPLPKPCGVVAGGETTVTVVGKGKGGRNQEIALSAASKISGMDGVVIASISTDGIDGPTDAAGALIDGSTLNRSKSKRLDVKAFLAKNDSYSLFSKLDDLIFTGLTGTNVNDISLIVVAK